MGQARLPVLPMELLSWPLICMAMTICKQGIRNLESDFLHALLRRNHVMCLLERQVGYLDKAYQLRNKISTSTSHDWLALEIDTAQS